MEKSGKEIATKINLVAIFLVDISTNEIAIAIAKFEEILWRLQHSWSEVELDLNGCQLNNSTLVFLHHMWKRHKDVKLKKLDLSSNELPQDISNTSTVLTRYQPNFFLQCSVA